MIFKLDEKNRDKLNKLFQTHEENLDFLEALRDYLFNPFTINIDSKDKYHEKMEVIKAFQEAFPNVKPSYWDCSIHNLDINEFISNPYLKLLKNVNFSINGWELTQKKIGAFNAFVFDDNITLGDYYKITSNIGYFTSDYFYPSISIEGNEWMSLCPNEIVTMRNPINRAKGKVLTLGLGLGYFAFMASEKDDVKEVHIVEMDKDLINIFQDKILPLFPHKEKIHIFKSDAFYFINNIDDYQYDYIFADLWHDVGDGLDMYLKLKSKFDTFVKTRVNYWIEDSLLTYFRMMVISVYKDKINRQSYRYDDVRDTIKSTINDLYFEDYLSIDYSLRVGSLYNLIKNK